MIGQSGRGMARGGGGRGEPPQPPEDQPPSSRLRYREFRRKRGWLRKREDQDPQTDPPTSPDQREPTFRDYLPQYRDLIRPHRWAILGLMGLGALAATMEMLTPAAFGVILNVLSKGDLPVGLERFAVEPLDQAGKAKWLPIICGGMLALILVARILEITRNIRTIALNHRMIVRLRRRLHRHMLSLPLSFIQKMKTGAMVSRLSNDVDRATGLVQRAIMSPAAALWRIAIGSVIMFQWNWMLALAAWAILPIMLLVSLSWVRRIRPIFRSAGRDRNEIDGRATETFGGIRVVRAFRREPRERGDYTVADDTMIRKRLFAYKAALSIDSAWQALIPISSIVLGGAGGYLYINGKADIGQIAAFQFYVPMLLGPIFRIVASLNSTQEALAAMERVFEVLEEAPDKPDAPDAIEAPATIARMEFDHVWFEYDQGRPVIKDFTLDVPGGAMVALVGPSGAGKTTMTDLIARFYDPTSGAIRVNGIDLRKMKLASYRRLLAVVQQEVFLFDGSVHQNIAYGKRGATREQVIAAAYRANAHPFITELPDGYDTLIGERGVKLSGGQRQRISIARAILADPQILILDEATSNLDTESERLIQSALNDLYENRTTFAIAHSLSTVTHADVIVVMHEGEVVEVGRHNDLMAREGMYYDMIQRQREFAEPQA